MPKHKKPPKTSWQYLCLAELIQIERAEGPDKTQNKKANFGTDAAHKLIMFLARKANDAGESYHGYQSICLRSDIRSETTLGHAIAFWCRLGILAFESKGSDKGTNLYRLNLEAMKALIVKQEWFDLSGKQIKFRGKDTLTVGVSDTLTVGEPNHQSVTPTGESDTSTSVSDTPTSTKDTPTSVFGSLTVGDEPTDKATYSKDNLQTKQPTDKATMSDSSFQHKASGLIKTDEVESNKPYQGKKKSGYVCACCDCAYIKGTGNVDTNGEWACDNCLLKQTDQGVIVSNPIQPNRQGTGSPKRAAGYVPPPQYGPCLFCDRNTSFALASNGGGGFCCEPCLLANNWQHLFTVREGVTVP